MADVKRYDYNDHEELVEAQRDGAYVLYSDYAVLEDENDSLKLRLYRIEQWCEAYPLECFPAPDWEAARKLLGDSEFSRLNAHSMRHVVEGVKRIAAVSSPPTAQGDSQSDFTNHKPKETQ